MSGTTGPHPFAADTVANLLPTRWLGRKSVWLDVVGSTNDEARRAAEEGAPEGLLVLSRTQSSGRGRMGRVWLSPLGGLWFSLLLRPKEPPAPLLSLVCSTAVCVAIEQVSGHQARIKWPNDVVLLPDLLKAGGLLLEGRMGGPDGGRSNENWVVIGIGLNASVNVNDLDPSVRDIATSISHEDIRADLLIGVLTELESRYERLRDGDHAALLAEARERCITLGRRVKVEWESGSVEGLAEELDPQGGLIVQTANGERQTIWSCLHCSLIR